jgi:ribosomal-protein-alanine N-acetyltransferase
MARVVLSSLARRDEREFLAAVARSRALHGRWVTPPRTRAQFRALIRARRGPHDFGFVARRAGSGELVGYLSITNVVRGNFQSGYLGYYAFAGSERRGLMSAALRLLVRLAFRDLGLHRLEANVQPENRPSIALVRACGFVREGRSARYLKIRGRWRDHERWARVAR